MTIEEFKKIYSDKGFSLMDVADEAARKLEGDPEFIAAAKKLVAAEDEFYELFLERGMTLG